MFFFFTVSPFLYHLLHWVTVECFLVFLEGKEPLAPLLLPFFLIGKQVGTDGKWKLQCCTCVLVSVLLGTFQN